MLSNKKLIIKELNNKIKFDLITCLKITFVNGK